MSQSALAVRAVVFGDDHRPDRSDDAGCGKPTITAVARLAGVSVATVSRTLNGSRGVAPETRCRVEAAIDVLNFTVLSSAAAVAQLRAHRSQPVRGRDVAGLAGVSTATVSRALKGRQVSAETRARVLQDAAELSYIPFTPAAELANRR